MVASGLVCSFRVQTLDRDTVVFFKKLSQFLSPPRSICCSSIFAFGTIFSEPVQNFWTSTKFFEPVQNFWTSTKYFELVQFFFVFVFASNK